MTDDKKSESSENFNKKVSSPSTTPLEPDKGNAWGSVEIVTERARESKKLDDEFDLFTKERADKIKKPNTPLDTTHLIINIPKNNLGTVKEDEEKSDIYSIASDTASSITQFCINQNYSEPDKLKSNADNIKSIPINIQTDSKEICSNIGPKRQDLDQIQKGNDSETGDSNIAFIDPLSKEAKRDSNEYNFDEIQRRPKVDTERDEAKKMPENKQFLRDRSASIGTIATKTPISQITGEQNRTMLFQVCTEHFTHHCKYNCHYGRNTVSTGTL